jgi:putative ABC transport system permease protein
MDNLIQDIRLSLRSLLKNRLVSILAVGSLALAISGNTTVFSLVNAILLRPLPYEDPDRLVFIWQTNQENPSFDLSPVSPANFVDWREASRSFTDIAALRTEPSSLTGGDRPEAVVGTAVTTSAFRILGAKPMLGRDFRPEEEEPGADKVVILSHRFWQTRFAGDPTLVGQTIELVGEPYQVIGVMPEDFELLDPRLQFWIPLALNGALPRDSRNLLVMARVRPEATAQDADQEISVIAKRLETEYPDENRGYGARVLTMREQLAYGGNREIMVLLQGALVFVLLIAAANVANLMLSRGQDRQREIAVRSALGAPRRRIVGQLFTESLLLAFSAGALGVALGYVGIRLMVGAFGEQLPRLFMPSLDSAVLVFTVGISIVAGLAFGLVPSLQASRPNLTETLHEGGGRGSSIGSRRRLLSKALVVAEVALALVMLSGAGMLIRSFQEFQKPDPGIKVDNLLVLQLGIPTAGYESDESVADFTRMYLEKLSGLPGVKAASMANHLPRTPIPPKSSFSVDGREQPDGVALSATTLTVSSGYLRTFQIPLLQGRRFREADRFDAPPVVMVNQALAAIHWPEKNPLGERITLQGVSREITAVVGNVREDMLLDSQAGAEPILYIPQAQVPSRALAVFLSTTPPPRTLIGPARDALLEVDRKITASQIQTYEELLDQMFVGMRVIGTLLTSFGALALILAAVGIYGVLAFSVSRRTHEIGIRMAMGAHSSDVLKLVTREGLVLVAIGFAIGLPGILLVSAGVSQAMSGLVTVAPSTSIAVGVVLLLVSLIACYVPARRAAGLHPLIALRYE